MKMSLKEWVKLSGFGLVTLGNGAAIYMIVRNFVNKKVPLLDTFDEREWDGLEPLLQEFSDELGNGLSRGKRSVADWTPKKSVTPSWSPGSCRLKSIYSNLSSLKSEDIKCPIHDYEEIDKGKKHVKKLDFLLLKELIKKDKGNVVKVKK